MDLPPTPNSDSKLSVSSPPSLPLSSASASQLPPSAQLPQPAIKRRAGIACRRCRRMRSKCLHDKGNPPCKSCVEIGRPDDCIFPKRGEADADRQFRHPRQRADKKPKTEVAKVRRESSVHGGLAIRPGIAIPSDEWELLQPLTVDDVIQGVDTFTRHYFQLGFIPKKQFPERIRQNPRSVSVLLLLSIISISARFNPTISQKWGSGLKAVEVFIERAALLAMNEIYQQPTLERCQAFFLLSIAQQGSGLTNTSYVNMGIATRMAALMRLHREETYNLASDATEEQIIEAESARRTFWVLHSQDNLHSGPCKPVSFADKDITALLPADEKEFAKGIQPRMRAALERTPPALANPALVSIPDRSLFATLMQVHNLWGAVSRQVLSNDKSSRPEDPHSDYAIMEKRLRAFEETIPTQQRFGEQILDAHRFRKEELAYISSCTTLRLCNIVIRKAYLDIMLRLDTLDLATRRFYSNMAVDLWRNVRGLYDQIDAQFTDRSPGESVGAQMSAFCVYSCGWMSTYLMKYPHVCPEATIAREGRTMFRRTLSILHECKEVWPLASRWVEKLDKFAAANNTVAPVEGTMTDGKEAMPHALLRFSASPSMHRQPGFHGPRPTPPPQLDEKRHLHPQPGPGSSTPILPPPPPPPTNAMYMDRALPPPQSTYLPPPHQNPSPTPHQSHTHGHSPHHQGLSTLSDAATATTNTPGHIPSHYEQSHSPQNGGPTHGPPPPAHFHPAQYSMHVSPVNAVSGVVASANNDGYEEDISYFMDSGMLWGVAQGMFQFETPSAGVPQTPAAAQGVSVMGGRF